MAPYDVVSGQMASYDVVSTIHRSLVMGQRSPADELELFRRLSLDGAKYCYNSGCEVVGHRKDFKVGRCRLISSNPVMLKAPTVSALETRITHTAFNICFHFDLCRYIKVCPQCKTAFLQRLFAASPSPPSAARLYQSAAAV